MFHSVAHSRANTQNGVVVFFTFCCFFSFFKVQAAAGGNAQSHTRCTPGPVDHSRGVGPSQRRRRTLRRVLEPGSSARRGVGASRATRSLPRARVRLEFFNWVLPSVGQPAGRLVRSFPFNHLPSTHTHTHTHTHTQTHTHTHKHMSVRLVSPLVTLGAFPALPILSINASTNV